MSSLWNPPATAVIFPGQGSQVAGMGATWVDHPAWAVVEEAEAALGEPLAPLLLTATDDDLAPTRPAQLAMLLHGLVAWRAFAPTLAGAPVAFAGHSLGQVTALIAAGAMSLADGVRFAAERARATQEAADRQPGRMAALLGVDEATAVEACQAAEGSCWVANDNAPGQVVVAGTPEGVEAATAAARALGAKVLPLKVGGAFHTPLMAEAADELAPILAQATFADPTAPVVANTDARAHRDGEGWPARLAQHLVQPVRWRGSVVALAELGATAVVELGAAGRLGAMVRRTDRSLATSSVISPADLIPATEPLARAAQT
ncbi:ACP S-malonyltransferase [soil metagenome]